MRSYYIEAEFISEQCEYCPKFEADTITIEQYDLGYKGEGKTESKLIGYVNKVRCKHFDQCKKIFEKDWKVTKKGPPFNARVQSHNKGSQNKKADLKDEAR